MPEELDLNLTSDITSDRSADAPCREQNGAPKSMDDILCAEQGENATYMTTSDMQTSEGVFTSDMQAPEASPDMQISAYETTSPAAQTSDGEALSSDGDSAVSGSGSDGGAGGNFSVLASNSPVSGGDNDGDGDAGKRGRKKGGKREYSPDLLIYGKGLLSKLKEALVSVLPISLVVFILCLTPIVDVTAREAGVFAACAVLLILGIGLFNLGADLAMTPMGEQMGAGLTKTRNLTLLVGVCFVMGILVTVAEPDLSVLAGQVSAIMNKGLLIVTVGIGVGLFLVLAVLKVVYKKNITAILIFLYFLMFAMVALLLERGKGQLLPLIFDSGGVTTGPITVPFIMALGVGISTTVGGVRSKANSFGLIAMCSIGPMLAVLVLSLASSGNLSYELPDYSILAVGEIGGAIGKNALEVLIALGLIVISFLILQFTLLKLPGRKMMRIGIGIAYTFIGLLIFFTAVQVGFMPIGFKLGQSLAKFSKPLLVVFSFLMGFAVVLAEPAVHVLTKQVYEVTGGAVSKRSMLIALSIGVGLSIGLSVIRVIFGFSLLYYLIPGYVISLGLSLFVPKLYTAIAFDAGGVASGPLTASFILPFAIGACTVMGGEGQVLEAAFGVVAMVAMTPLITIQLLGFRSIFAARFKQQLTMRRIVAADDAQIIEFM